MTTCNGLTTVVFIATTSSVLACPGTGPDRIRTATPPGAQTHAACAYPAVETLNFIDRVGFWSISPSENCVDDIDRILDSVAGGRESLPIWEKGPLPGVEISPTSVTHPEKGIILGRFGYDDWTSIFSDDGHLNVHRIEVIHDPRLVEIVQDNDFGQSLGPCRRGACPIGLTNKPVLGFWFAVRVLDGNEYLAGVFPCPDDECHPPDGSLFQAWFDAWIDAIDARWGPPVECAKDISIRPCASRH